MFEHHSKPILSTVAFARRILNCVGITAVFLSGSLAFGVLGYRYFEGLSWIDSLLNAAMILGGMGEIDALHTNGGKLFAAFYAIYSGIFLVVCGGLLLVPVFHRVLHKFHADS